MIIRTKAPVRISFAGGGTDVSPYCEERGGCVVNVAINKYAWGTLELTNKPGICISSSNHPKILRFNSVKDITYNRTLDLLKSVVKHMHNGKKGINLFLRSDVPPRSGLGSSASAFVSMIGLFNHLKRDKKITDYEIAELAFNLERKELNNMGGKQDQYASVFGGLNYIEFKGNDFIRVNPLRLKQDYINELEKNLVLVHVGARKASGDIIKDQTKSYKKHNKNVTSGLDKTKEIAIETKYALTRGDLDYFGELLHDAWTAKKKFSSMITNPYIDKLYNLARKKGAIGGKISGAGGGGHMILYCKPNKEQIVAHELTKAGVKIVPFSFDYNGLQSWEVNENGKNHTR